jgi:hypothetical protein
LSVIEDLRDHSLKLDSKVSSYREKVRTLRAENEELRHEVEVLRSSMTSDSPQQNTSGSMEYQEKLMLREQLEQTLTEMKKMTTDRQKLMTKFKQQKKELKEIKNVRIPQYSTDMFTGKATTRRSFSRSPT